MPNNRELASLVWLGIVAAWLLTRDGVRRSIVDAARAAWRPAILVPFAALGMWTIAEVGIGVRIDLWDSSLATSTLAWFVASACGLMLNLPDAKDLRFFRAAFVDTLKVGAILQVIFNLVVFPLAAELVFVPVIAVLSMMSVVAPSQPNGASAKRAIDSALALIGFAFAAYVLWTLASNSRAPFDIEVVRALALEIWMTLGVLPFLYVLALYEQYEVAFLRVNFATDDALARRRTKLALCSVAGISVTRVARFTGPLPSRTASAASWYEARRLLRGVATANPSAAASSRRGAADG